MIGFHQISLSTFIRNFALYCKIKKLTRENKIIKYELACNLSLRLLRENSILYSFVIPKKPGLRKGEEEKKVKILYYCSNKFKFYYIF